MDQELIPHRYSSWSFVVVVVVAAAAATAARGVARNLFRRGTKPEDLGQKSPSGVQGHSPGGGLGAKPAANNHCNNVLTKNP